MEKYKSNQGLEMYFNQDIAYRFADHEQNPEHIRVANIVDAVIMHEITEILDLPSAYPLFVAELGGGAHPDRYDHLFTILLSEPKGHMDWIDLSLHMVEYAQKCLQKKPYQARQQIIAFKVMDILDYLDQLPADILDVAIMKYTLNYISTDDIVLLFELLAKKLKQKGRLVATVSSLDGELKSHAPNARFLYKGKAIPFGTRQKLEESGDSYQIKFFQEFNNPAAGYLEGAETTVFYHPRQKLEQLAARFNFDIFLGNWKNLLPQAKEPKDLDILVLRK